MKKSILIILLFFYAREQSYGQLAARSPLYLIPATDSLQKAKQKKNRVILVTAVNVAGYGGTLVGLYNAWYKNYPQTGFHFFNDMAEWKQMDKVGHLFSAYQESRASTDTWRWAGLNRRQYTWIGGMSGAFYQTVIEVLDGFSAGWGWSWGDFGANMLVSGLFVSQEMAWQEQRILIKFSTHRKKYDDPLLVQRSNELFGRSSAERFLKDYNGQTYWASANLRSFFPHSRIPKWLNLSMGYGAEGMFGGRKNLAVDEAGAIRFDRRDIPRRRQFYLAPDVDLTRLKTRSKFLRTTFSILNTVKFPLPALELSGGKLSLHAISF